jgi:hypothetical protein
MKSGAQRGCRLSQENVTCQWRGGRRAATIAPDLKKISAKEVVRVEGADDVLIIQGERLWKHP